MRIRIDHPTFVRLNLSAGDELIIQKPTPEVETLLSSVRADGVHFARPINDDGSEIAVAPSDEELAVTGRGRQRGQRSAVVS